jgi:hypothetical protein
MKRIVIDIRVDDASGKIATAWKTDGYSSKSIQDNLEMIGLLENTKDIIKNKIKTLGERTLDD